MRAIAAPKNSNAPPPVVVAAVVVVVVVVVKARALLAGIIFAVNREPQEVFLLLAALKLVFGIVNQALLLIVHVRIVHPALVGSDASIGDGPLISPEKVKKTLVSLC